MIHPPVPPPSSSFPILHQTPAPRGLLFPPDPPIKHRPPGASSFLPILQSNTGPPGPPLSSRSSNQTPAPRGLLFPPDPPIKHRPPGASSFLPILQSNTGPPGPALPWNPHFVRGSIKPRVGAGRDLVPPHSFSQGRLHGTSFSAVCPSSTRAMLRAA
jgi:hypothetical protein